MLKFSEFDTSVVLLHIVNNSVANYCCVDAKHVLFGTEEVYNINDKYVDALHGKDMIIDVNSDAMLINRQQHDPWVFMMPLIRLWNATN